jgi:uncharacterized protein involved in outer membrane biogenesis
MARVAKILAIGIGVLVLMIGTGAALFQWNWVRGWAGERAGLALGRSMSVEGDLKVDLFSRTPGLRAERVRVANADWGSAPAMVEIAVLDVRVRLRDLLRGRLTVTQLGLTEPRILLEKSGDGRANWDFEGRPGTATATKAAIPAQRTRFPVIERLVIENGRFAYRDPGARIDTESEVNTALGSGRAEDALRLTGSGTVQGKPFRLDAQAGSLLTLRQEGAHYPVSIVASVGQTRASIEGTIAAPLDFDGIDVAARIAGSDMADLFGLTGVPLPPSGRYALEGRLRRDGDRWAFNQFSGTVGRSDLRGDVAFDFGRERPFLNATLASHRLDFNDLAGFVGSDPDDKAGKAPPGRVLPHTPINLDKLRAMDMRVSFQGRDIIAPGVPLQRLSAQLSLVDGRATLNPISVGLAGGTLAGSIVLDARKAVPAAQVNVDVSRIDLANFFKGSPFAGKMTGLFGGRIQLAGQGRSTAELLASGNGRMSLVMGDGRMSNLLLELAGIDIAEALGFALGKDKPVQVRCAVADFLVRQGRMDVRNFVFDTTDTAITGGGQIDLGQERLQLTLKAYPKDPSLFAARTPITIGGTFGKPEAGIDPKELAARGGVAAALSALLTPLAALLPFIELGLGEDSPCEQLIQQALR